MVANKLKNKKLYYKNNRSDSINLQKIYIKRNK